MPYCQACVKSELWTSSHTAQSPPEMALASLLEHHSLHHIVVVFRPLHTLMIPQLVVHLSTQGS